VEQAQLEARLPRGELEARQRIDGGHVCAQRPDVAAELSHCKTRRSGTLEFIAADDEFRESRTSQ
jgi:hypothetical protein